MNAVQVLPSNLTFPSDSRREILYMDIGGTNFRAFRYPRSTPYAFISHIEHMPGTKVPSFTWKNLQGNDLTQIIFSFPEVFDGIDKILVSISDHGNGDQRTYRGYLRGRGVPAELSHHFEQSFQLTYSGARIFHDSLAWAHGMCHFLRHRGETFPSPIGLLVIGTGVCFAIIDSHGPSPIEAHDRSHNLQRLNQHAGRNAGGRAVHDHIAKRYFDWRSLQKWNAISARKDTQERMQIVLNELSRVHGLDRLIISGGYASEFESCRFDQEVECLTKTALPFDPGFFPLIGLCALGT